MSEEEAKDKAKEAFLQGKSYTQVSKDTGISISDLRKLRKEAREQEKVDKLAESSVEVKPSLDFQDSPSPVVEKKGVDAALDSLKGMLGIKSTGTKTTPKPLSSVGAKLNAKQQTFVDSTSPTLALGLISLATWAWTRIGDEYHVLAPDEQVALRIVTPLLRIYARHQTFLVDVNPDVADIGASIFAIVAYVHVSYNLYLEIKSDKETEQEDYGSDRNGSYAPTQPESTVSGSRDRYADVSRRDRRHADTASVYGRVTPDIGGATLTKEERQHQALLRLSHMDYEHRARRSGRA